MVIGTFWRVTLSHSPIVHFLGHSHVLISCDDPTVLSPQLEVKRQRSAEYENRGLTATLCLHHELLWSTRHQTNYSVMNLIAMPREAA